MKKPFIITDQELATLWNIYSQGGTLTEGELQNKANEIWQSLGEKYGFVWNTVEQITHNIPPDEEGRHWLAEPVVIAKTTRLVETIEAKIPMTPTPREEQPVQPAQAENDSKQKLVVFLEGMGLAELEKEQIRKSFMPFFDQAASWFQIAKTLVVTDISQVTEMKKAKDARLALKRIRTSVEGVRKQLKEEINIKGRAIDGIANMLKSAIEPIEEHLDAQEHFAEIEELKRRQKLAEERLIELQKYDFQYSSGFSLGDMDDEHYESFKTGLRLAYEDRIKEEEENRKIIEEQERIKALHAQRIKETNHLLPYMEEWVLNHFGTMTNEEYDEVVAKAIQAKINHEQEVERLQKQSNELKELAKKVNARRAEILNLGVTTNGKLLYYKQTIVPVKASLEDIINMPVEEDYREVFDNISRVIADHIEEIDRVEKEKHEAELQRNSRLVDVQSKGYVKLGDDWVYRDKKGFNLVIIRNSMIDTLTNEQWIELLESQDIKIQAKKLEENPPVKEEPVKTEEPVKAEKTDEQKMIAILNQIIDWQAPTMTTKKGKELIEKLGPIFQQAINLISNAYIK